MITTRTSSDLHTFKTRFVTPTRLIHHHCLIIPLVRSMFHADRIFPRISTLGNRIPCGCFPEHFNINIFKSRINISFISWYFFTRYFHHLRSYHAHSVNLYLERVLCIVIGENWSGEILFRLRRFFQMSKSIQGWLNSFWRLCPFRRSIRKFRHKTSKRFVDSSMVYRRLRNPSSPA